MDPITLALLIITVSGALLLSTPYLLYPGSLALLRPRAQDDADPSYQPFVSVLIPAYNEAENIVEKLENALSQSYPRHRFEILLGDDGSQDDTVRLASRFMSRGVRMFLNSRQGGKWAMLRELADFARGEVLVLTDAQSLLNEEAISSLVQALSPHDVGAATARYEVRGDAPQRSYWSFSTHLKQAEARRGMLLGAHGAAWAIKRDVLGDMSTPMINDDYALALDAHLRGWRIAYAPGAVATEPATPTWEASFARWKRIAQGNLEMLSTYRRALHPGQGRTAWALVATKLLKTLGPVFLLMTLLGAAGLSLLHATPLAAGSALAGAALLMSWPRARRAMALGLTAQLAISAGLLARATGARVDWDRSVRKENTLPVAIAITKRALDVTLSGIGLLLGAPLLALCAVAIKLDSRGPVFFGQERVRHVHDGEEETFTMYKLRTMVQDAEARSGPVWAQDADPRITRVGALLRKSRLDELPQLWNVLRGDMSLVGPRPERPFFTATLRDMIPGYDDRVSPLKPGITGWAQIHCGYDTSIESVRQKILFDLTYMAHLYSMPRYLGMEARILASTVVVALTGRGAK